MDDDGSIRPPLKVPGEVLPLLATLRKRRQEALVTVLLDARMRPLRVVTVAVGEAAHVASTTREVFRVAVARGARALLLAHNHPSGEVEPSPADLRLTERACLAGNILGIEVIDHLIVTRNAWFSFRSHGCWPVSTGSW